MHVSVGGGAEGDFPLSTEPWHGAWPQNPDIMTPAEIELVA